MNLSKEREAEIRTRHRNGTDACDTCHLLAALDAERERVKALEKAIEELIAHGVPPHVEDGLHDILARLTANTGEK